MQNKVTFLWRLWLSQLSHAMMSRWWAMANLKIHDGISLWRPVLGLLSWYPIFGSNNCNSFEDWVPNDFIYGWPISECVAEIPTSLLQWRHNERNGVSNHQPHDRLLNRLFRRRSKKTSKLHVTGLREGNTQVTGKFPSQRASNAENASIWWGHHDHRVPG